MWSFLAKWVGLEALKKGLKVLIFKTLIHPALDSMSKQIKKYIDDPATDGDEELERAINKFSKYQAEKWLGRYF